MSQKRKSKLCVIKKHMKKTQTTINRMSRKGKIQKYNMQFIKYMFHKVRLVGEEGGSNHLKMMPKQDWKPKFQEGE